MTRRSALGKRGEQAAADHLTQQGYRVIDANWRCPTGEFDLIARKGEMLVFVEVKTRHAGIEAAFESINPRKQRILENLVYRYLSEHALECDWRIDVIAVTLAPDGQPTIEHVQDAFDW